MSSLPYLEALLTLTGNRLDNKLLGFRSMGVAGNWIIRVAITANFVYLMREKILVGIQFKLQSMSLLSIGMIVLFMFARRRSRIEDLLRRLSSQESCQSVKCLTMFSFLFAASLITFQIAINCTFIFLREGNVWNGLFRILIHLPYYLNEYIIHYPLFYIIVLKIFSYYEVQQLQRMKQEISTKAPFRVMNEIKRLSQIRSEFEQLFNFVPFVLFGVFFLTIPHAIISILRSDIFTGFVIIGYTIQNSCFLIVGILLIHHVCTSRDKVNDVVTHLIEIIHRNHMSQLNTNGYQALIDVLKSYADFSFTGWYLFTIDRSLVLTFVSSIITFSVLLIQLEPSRPQT